MLCSGVVVTHCNFMIEQLVNVSD